MTANEIRKVFLDFFASKGHKIIPSAPIVAKNDPTLLFVNSGMAPLKDFFLGNQTPPSLRIADTQKCLRVSGKHNDLEDVGIDGYHHTLFEMLGNWSFGDYFKKEAIAWSWELLTEVLKLPKDRLYATIFKGDEKDKLPFDQEAFDFWMEWLPKDRILPFSKKDNFWEMGEAGPCGPCSEIHIDLRSDEERSKTPGHLLVNADDPNVIEIWNNVFMQFDRKADGSLVELPAKSVDTGMGFERLCRAVQGKNSNYDTDVFQPLINFLSKYANVEYTETYPGINEKYSKTDIALRVVADHLRAVSFTIADGELPSNTGAGYVIRRILRRAVRYSYSFLNIKEPIIYRMVSILAAQFKEVFPELAAQEEFVAKVILEEEKSFLRTLEAGLRRFEQLAITDNTIGGSDAFEMYDTYGFPIDLTRLLAKEKGYLVDDEGFEVALAGQRARSRKDAVKEVGDWVVLQDENDIQFVGYDQLEVRNAFVTKYRTVNIKGRTETQLVLNRTPFFPESGGQVGDTGTMIFGKEKINVLDTKKENDLIIHILERLPLELDDPKITCQVHESKRHLTESNHSATHLLHAALRQVVGTHVQQKGSFLNHETLRFDFSHFQKVTDEQIKEIESIVNTRIRENIALQEARDMPIEKARESGAMMLFGEKYGEKVRMITFDAGFSRELCGGCHVKSTGQIGFFKITSEGAVAAGVRRIEALTGIGAEQYVSNMEQDVVAVRNMLKTNDLAKAVGELQEQNKKLQKDIERMVQEQANTLQIQLRSNALNIGGINTVSGVIAISDANAIRSIAAGLEQHLGNAYIVLGAISPDGKPTVSVRISETLVKEKGWHAGNIVKTVAQAYLNGGGGGQPVYATAGGTNAEGLEAAIQAAMSMIQN